MTLLDKWCQSKIKIRTADSVDPDEMNHSEACVFFLFLTVGMKTLTVLSLVFSKRDLGKQCVPRLATTERDS